jgi:PadR family transcriptional regulator, regulatory protein PadR
MRLTGPLQRVLMAFLADPAAPQYGYDLMKAAALPSGTLYPMLARLQQEGLVTSEWETQAGDAGGRPPRKYYRLTGDGVRVARLELAQAAMVARGTSRARSAGGTARPAPGNTARAATPAAPGNTARPAPGNTARPATRAPRITTRPVPGEAR